MLKSNSEGTYLGWLIETSSLSTCLTFKTPWQDFFLAMFHCPSCLHCNGRKQKRAQGPDKQVPKRMAITPIKRHSHHCPMPLSKLVCLARDNAAATAAAALHNNHTHYRHWFNVSALSPRHLHALTSSICHLSLSLSRVHTQTHTHTHLHTGIHT